MSPYETPTLRQLELLGFIATRADAGIPPTIREMQDEFQILSTNGVRDHLVALERKGCIERCPKKSRHIRVTELGLRWLHIPVTTETSQ